MSKCIYCDFYSIVNRTHEIDSFTHALIKEFELSAESYKSLEFDTIFIGGGTPSLLPPAQLEKIIEALYKYFNLNITEFSMESNPDTINESNLQNYFDLGVNRLSIGMQTFDNKLLKNLRRIHSSSDSINAFEMARKVGFNNINIDLIFNLPNQNTESWKSDLITAFELNPEHISAYSLTVERDTPLFQKVTNNQIILPHEDVDEELFTLTRKLMKQYHFNGYEISNFAKPGFECEHNLHYWNLDTTLAFGPSAHGFDGQKRWWNHRNLNLYLEKLNQNNLPIEGYDILSNTNHFNELILNGLRLSNGVNLALLSQYYERNLHNYLLSKIEKWNEKLIIENNCLKLTESGLLLTDEITADLFL